MRLRTPPIKFTIDAALWTLAATLAFWVRLDLPLQQYGPQMLVYSLGLLPVRAALIYAFGLHRQSWHKVGVRDLYVLARAIGFVTLVLYALGFLLYPYSIIPRSVPLIDGTLALLFLGGARLLTRFYHERVLQRQAQGTSKRVLIVGAGEAGTIIAREMLRHPEAGLEPVGFVDDEPSKQSQRFLGLPVLGRVESLPQIARDTNANEVLIAIPSASGRVVRHIVEQAHAAKLQYRIIPGVFEILSGKVSISSIRPVSLEDLLRRDAVRLNLSEIAGYLEDRVVLVTGAGGSIGSEIVRQVARYRPKRVILLGRGENSIYQIQQELIRTWPELEHVALIADVRARDKLETVFARYRPQVVFHAAAHKHVPLMEQSPDEAILNNVGGTKNLCELALQYGVERLVNISTDKAVNPTSVMGASKRVSEMIVEMISRRARADQVFVSVRFGNVLGSRGSVIPLFQAQILAGGPVTVTHPEMTRYFMTIPEASQLVLQAGSLGVNGSLYVLDMGEPVRILDLAQDLIRLSGFEIGKDIDIAYSGLRPGEKLYEELLTAEEGTTASKHEKIFMARKVGLDDARLEHSLKQLFEAARARNDRTIRDTLRDLVPGAKLEVGVQD
jgi:FlaA1/EpsC-like NDP-sugar epimerase